MTEQHSDCLTCAYWAARIEAEKARALAGCDGAFDDEKRVRKELDEHLERTAVEAR